MTALLIIIFCCAVLLVFFGALPLWAAAVLAGFSLVSMSVQAYLRNQEQKRLKQRMKSLAAQWGMKARHLIGLPIPQNSWCNLFLLNDALVLETDQEQMPVKISDIHKIVPVKADLIRKITDAQLFNFLEAGNCRSFSILRELIRHDSSFHHASILMIVTCQPEDDPDLTILSFDRSVGKIDLLIRHSHHLKGKVDRRLLIGSN